jgi:hypothetical protein
MRTNHQGVELNYPAIDKQAYAYARQKTLQILHPQEPYQSNHASPHNLIPIYSTEDGGKKSELDGSSPRI